MSHLKTCMSPRKTGHTGKSFTLTRKSHLEKRVTLLKMIQPWKNGSHLQNWVPLGKKVAPVKGGHTWKNG